MLFMLKPISNTVILWVVINSRGFFFSSVIIRMKVLRKIKLCCDKFLYPQLDAISMRLQYYC